MICGKRQIGAEFLGLAEVVRRHTLLGSLDDLSNGDLRERLPQCLDQVGPHAVVGQRDQFLGRKLSLAGLTQGPQEFAGYAVVSQFDDVVDGEIAISGGDQGG